MLLKINSISEFALGFVITLIIIMSILFILKRIFKNKV